MKKNVIDIKDSLTSTIKNISPMKIKMFFKNQIMIVICLVLVIVSSIASDKFLTISNILSIFKQNSIIGVLAVGECIAIISGGVDASLAFIMCACVMIMGVFQTLPLWLIILIVLVVGFMIGTITGITIAYFNVVPFIATLAMGTVAEGVALLVNRGRPLYWGTNHANFIKIMGTGSSLGLPNLVISFFILVIVGQLILSRTKLGFSWRAIGGNSQAAFWSGIKSKLYTMLAYSFSGMIAALAAVFLIARVGVSDPTAGNTNTTDAMTAAVLGGTFIGGKGKGTISGALLGVFILGMINNIFNLVGISSYVQFVAKGLILIIAVVIGSKSVASKGN